MSLLSILNTSETNMTIQYGLLLHAMETIPGKSRWPAISLTYGWTFHLLRYITTTLALKMTLLADNIRLEAIYEGGSTSTARQEAVRTQMARQEVRRRSHDQREYRQRSHSHTES